MLGAFLRFEIGYWLRGWMAWIFMAIIGLMIWGAASSDNVVVGSALQNTKRNAPFVIQTYYGIIGVLTLLMTTAFVNSAASRDFQYNTAGMIFSTPLKKRDFVLGRFFGSALIAVLPMLGVTLGVICAPLAPWADADRFGPIHWAAHLKSVLVFALPNTLFCGSVAFTIAVLTRSTVTSFLGSLALLVAYGVADAFTSDLRNEFLAAMLDPFGISAFGLIVKYWTVAERNSLTVGLEGPLLWNRLIWLGVTGLILAFAYNRFSFAERSVKAKKQKATKEEVHAPVTTATPTFQTGPAAEWAQFTGSFRFELFGLVKSTPFIVILAAALLNCIPSLALSATEGYGNSTLPVTYWILDIIQGTLLLFLYAIITYYAGVMVWRERDAKMDEIEDVTPRRNWTQYAAKLLSLIAAIGIIYALMIVVGVIVQTYHQYTRYQIGLYIQELFLFEMSTVVFLTILAFLIHTISPNKYVGYFGFLGFLIANAFIWRPLNIATRLVRYPSRPGGQYSDMFGYAPYLNGYGWFTLYWSLFAALLVVATLLMWPRGKEGTFLERLREARLRFSPGMRMAAALAGAGFLAVGGWLVYNTMFLNPLPRPETELELRTAYEKTYKKFAKLAQPRITAIRYRIDLVPERRAMTMRAEQTIVNKHDKPIDELHLSYDRDYSPEVSIDGASVKADDTRLQYRIYKLSPAMQPGEQRTMKYTLRYEPRGVTDGSGILQFVQNGTFFNNGIAPQIGYQADGEISDKNERKKRGLPEKDLMAPLERDCTINCANTYLSNNSDWVSVESVISTSPDQIAIAPGSLVREWTENGRRYFEYKLDKNSLNFYSFLSARYEVLREDVAGLKAEVYWHKEHPWNVPRMMNSIRKSIDYFTKNFGPYYHKQVRIIEFPRVASFAQAFPGSMPYSESIGFIARLDKPDSIDFVFYVVAHEIAHQWWAHQVIGANMQGATSLSETLAQYSALMVMEKEYGRDAMRKFLEYEMDRYLRARGREQLKERPLMRVEANQGYTHYQKGSLVMYYMREMIGEDAVNRALRKLVEKYAYAGPPYPTSHALVDALREETPENLRYLIKDLFEDITLFSNRTLEAKSTKRADGKWDVTIEVESKKFKADEQGNEKEVPVADYVEIGAYSKPEKGKKYGKLLHRQRVHMTQPKAKFSFVVAEQPEKAGIDPLALLVDRIPDDNMKKVDGGA